MGTLILIRPYSFFLMRISVGVIEFPPDPLFVTD